jgi:hypothetical protein
MNREDDSTKAPASRSSGDFTGEALADNRARFAVTPPSRRGSCRLGSCHEIHELKGCHRSVSQFHRSEAVAARESGHICGAGAVRSIPTRRGCPIDHVVSQVQAHFRVDNGSCTPCPVASRTPGDRSGGCKAGASCGALQARQETIHELRADGRAGRSVLAVNGPLAASLVHASCTGTQHCQTTGQTARRGPAALSSATAPVLHTNMSIAPSDPQQLQGLPRQLMRLKVRHSIAPDFALTAFCLHAERQFGCKSAAMLRGANHHVHGRSRAATCAHVRQRACRPWTLPPTVCPQTDAFAQSCGIVCEPCPNYQATVLGWRIV